MQVFPLASEYLAEEVIKKCEDVIRSRCSMFSKHLAKCSGENIEFDEILKYLTVCEKCSLDGTVIMAVANSASYITLSELRESRDYESLSDKTKLLIATKRLEKFEWKYPTYDKNLKERIRMLNIGRDNGYKENEFKFLINFQQRKN